MTLQEIVDNFEKKSWLRMCTLHGHKKWDLISFVNEPVFVSKFFINPDFKVTTKVCNTCGLQLDIGIYKGTFIVKKTCKCGNDGTHLMTFEKLRCALPDELAKLAITQTNAARMKGLANTTTFWINKGFNILDANQKVAEIQTLRSHKSPASKKGARGYSNRTVEFWIKKGYSESDAKKKISQLQVTNGLDYYKTKFGDAGEQLFNERIAKWLNSPGNKKMISGRSKNSISLFNQLGVGYYGEDEKVVRGKLKVHRVDFLYGNIIIEFYGDYWHGNPTIFSNGAMIRKKKIEDVWEHDCNKIADLRDTGYNVLVIWENDYLIDPTNVLITCKNFINEYYNTANRPIS
jgi:G:T-mismatch repair DNA endonuclease (very short patch repair protein)